MVYAPDRTERQRSCTNAAPAATVNRSRVASVTGLRGGTDDRDRPPTGQLASQRRAGGVGPLSRRPARAPGPGVRGRGGPLVGAPPAPAARDRPRPGRL